MKRFYTVVSVAALLFTGLSTMAENPYAPTGDEQVTGELQLLYHPTKDKVNILKDAAQLGEGADGWSVQCMNESKNLEQAGSITVSGSTYASIKLSNGAQNTVTLPEGKVANAVTIYSTMNADAPNESKPCFFSEVDGVKYDKPSADYLSSYKDFTNPDVSYFTLKGNNSFTFTNSGQQVLVVLVVDYSDAPSSPFGDGELAAPASVWPKSGSRMLPLAGDIRLTYTDAVEVFGQATVGDTKVDLKLVDGVVTIPYTGLEAMSEVTVTIPAGAIGNAEASNAELTLTYTAAPADVLFYSDFNMYPYGFYREYGLNTENYNIIAANSTDVTVGVADMTFYSGLKGRVVLLSDAVNGATTDDDYGPYSEADAGASNRAVQLIDGGNGLYFETPEFEGPAEVTFYIGNATGNAGAVQLTDERGKEYTLGEFAYEAAKRMFKFTYSYPYKGTAKLRLYNNKNKVDINDFLIVKGEGEGIDRPVNIDDEAPQVLRSWPSDAPYAPLEGSVTVVYNEPVTCAAKAQLNGADLDVVVDGGTLTVAYSGLENGKEYTMTIPAVTDEAGNATEAMTVTINTIAADVIYYTDFHYYPYAYYEKYCTIPNDAADNEDIIAKNSTDVTAEVAGLTYYSGTLGRVVAMGKPNIIDAGEEGASERCIQINGGGNGLYLELPATQGAAEVTFYVGNSAEKTGDLILTGADGNTEAPLAKFALDGEKKMYKFTYTHTEDTPVTFRLYNMGLQCNIHDILLVEAEAGGSSLDTISASGDVETVYYNLQGVRVANPEAGLYIRVRGNVVDKVIVK